jgi:hypothetical protein
MLVIIHCGVGTGTKTVFMVTDNFVSLNWYNVTKKSNEAIVTAEVL